MTSATVFLLLALVLVSSVTSCDRLRGRGRRSDDTNPMDAVVSGLVQKVDQLTAQVTSLQTRLDTVEQPVAFTVRFRSVDVTGLGKGQTLHFDNVLYNAGSGYSPASGFFTAPSSGTYAFYVQVMRHGSDDYSVELDLYKEGSMLERAQACCAPYESGSTFSTVHLQQGDAVHVQVNAGSMLYGGTYTSFSGIKVSPL